MLRHSLSLLCLFTLGSLFAQRALDRSAALDPILLIHMGYGSQSAQADLANRFTDSWGMELGVDIVPKQSNWSYGIFGQYIFGSEVLEDVLAGLRTSDGIIVGNQRDPADVQLRMRAYFGGLRLGKTLPLGNNKRTGIKLGLGAGWLGHYIRVQNDPVQAVNQLVGDYRKGYDRLSTGPALYQFLGFQQLSANGLLNFHIGLEAFEAFTSAQRDFDFATAASLPEQRLDVLLGLRVGFIITLYRGEGREIFYR